jgi:hypothetical protein
VSRISRESIDALKQFFRDEMTNADWLLVQKLMPVFNIKSGGGGGGGGGTSASSSAAPAGGVSKQGGGAASSAASGGGTKPGASKGNAGGRK